MCTKKFKTEFLEELEKSMALLAFDDTSTSPVGYLFHTSQRLRTASELNAAILISQSQKKDPNLPNLLKMLVWAQDELDEEVTYPKMESLTIAELIETNNNNNGNGNGNNDINNNFSSININASASTSASNSTSNSLSNSTTNLLYLPTLI